MPLQSLAWHAHTILGKPMLCNPEKPVAVTVRTTVSFVKVPLDRDDPGSRHSITTSRSTPLAVSAPHTCSPPDRPLLPASGPKHSPLSARIGAALRVLLGSVPGCCCLSTQSSRYQLE